ncbi:MAG: pantetheine-phosphate adenylyltransferase [Candidatus Thermoplasmatota archaeon]
MKVCLGGTFDFIHKGHQLLLDKAFSLAGKNGLVFIGVCSDEMIKNKNKNKSLKSRIKSVKKYISNKDFQSKTKIDKIEDKYGPAIEGDFDAIVVSPETHKVADEINQKRQKIGKKNLKISTIPYAMAEDGKPISSTRIRKKEINENGKITK